LFFISLQAIETQDAGGSCMKKYRIPLMIVFILLLALEGYSAKVPLSRWMSLRSDAKEQVRGIIRSEVDSRDGFSTPQEEKANLNAVENEKEAEDAGYKKAIAAANREFSRAKKRRDDVTTQFQAVSTELEDHQKNISTIRSGIDNLDSQVARYNQDIHTQQEALKKWLQTEKQGEALVAVIFTRGFKDKAHHLETLSDRISAPLMSQYMGTYIHSFTKVINSVLSVDFIRAIEEGTAKWNNEEPLRIELEKGNRGTTYLRLKRYELYPFQAPAGGRIKHPPVPKGVNAAVITSRKDLEKFLVGSGYSPASYELARAYNMIKEATQMNAAAEEGLHEHVRSFQERISSLQERIKSAGSEKDIQWSLLKKKEDQHRKVAQDTATVQSKKEEADRAFQNAQKSLHDIRRIRESTIVKTALATARGSQSPAEVSAEAIIDKLEEVKNDAKMQHSTSTTEVTNFQVTAESSYQAISEARITSVRLISFINEGDSVRVKMAFRVKTVLVETAEEVTREAPQPAPKTTTDQPPPPKEPPGKLSRFFSSLTKPADDDDGKKAREPEPAKAAPPREPVRRNPKAIGAAEAQDVLFEIIRANASGDQISVFVDVTNMAEENRNVALYDENYRWTKSKLTDTADKEHEVSQVIFWKDQQKTSMYDAGSRGNPIDSRTTQTVQLIFMKAPANLRTIKKLVIHPYIYQRTVFWTWKEHDLVFQNLRMSR
jgi:CRISPR/Cas system-associated exonuclease Cas4 (RecB family)